MTRHPPGGGSQLGLFGPAAPIPTPRTPGRESNDVELMHTVAANAIRCGYLLVGAFERVYARTEGSRSDVVRVPRYEEDAVHQLLARRWLTMGGNQKVICGAATLVGATLLVPKDTRTRVARWEHTQRPPSWPVGPSPRAPHTGPSSSACGDTGVIPNGRQMRWSPDKGVYREHSCSPCTWCARIPDKKHRRPGPMKA